MSSAATDACHVFFRNDPLVLTLVVGQSVSCWLALASSLLSLDSYMAWLRFNLLDLTYWRFVAAPALTV